jgi:hypothetical protein
MKLALYAVVGMLTPLTVKLDVTAPAAFCMEHTALALSKFTVVDQEAPVLVGHVSTTDTCTPRLDSTSGMKVATTGTRPLLVVELAASVEAGVRGCGGPGRWAHNNKN